MPLKVVVVLVERDLVVLVSRVVHCFRVEVVVVDDRVCGLDYGRFREFCLEFDLDDRLDDLRKFVSLFCFRMASL